MRKRPPPYPLYPIIMDACFWAQIGMALIMMVGGWHFWAAALTIASGFTLKWWWEARP